MSDLEISARSQRSNEADSELECVQEHLANNNRRREAISFWSNCKFISPTRSISGHTRPLLNSRLLSDVTATRCDTVVISRSTRQNNRRLFAARNLTTPWKSYNSDYNWRNISWKLSTSEEVSSWNFVELIKVGRFTRTNVICVICVRVKVPSANFINFVITLFTLSNTHSAFIAMAMHHCAEIDSHAAIHRQRYLQ